MKDEITNFYDDLTSGIDLSASLKQQQDNDARAKKLDYLIHQTFEQSESGKELLGIWKESLMMQPGASSGMDTVEIGIREGQKRFIRGIILTIQRVERDE